MASPRGRGAVTGPVGRDARGAALVEAVTAVAVLALVGMALVQVQLLAARTRQAASEQAAVHHALRQVVVWLEDDARMARQAQVDGATLTLSIEAEGQPRRVRYALEGDRLVRQLEDGDGTPLRRQVVAAGVTHWSAAYDGTLGLLAYEVGVTGEHGATAVLRGSVLLRNSTAGRGE